MDFAPPDSAVATAAEALVIEASPTIMLQHLYRTYWYGRALVTSDLDEDAAYIATMFHDLGLTGAFRGASSFEVVGAQHAASFLEGRGWDVDRIGLVERAIVRHTNVTPGEDPVELVVQGGAAFDVIGFPPDSIPTDVTNAVEEAFPREGFKEAILRSYLDEIEAQPHGAFAMLETSLNFSQLLQARPDL